MKKFRILAAVLMLALAALSCQTVLGGAKPVVAPSAATEPAIQQKVEPTQGVEAPEAPSEPGTDQGSGAVSSPFPMPDGATNVVDVGGSINFQVKMSLKDAIGFYRDSFGKLGLKEREINTVISDTTFSLVFDGDPGGKAIVVQGVDFGNGLVNVNIRYEDI